MIFNILVWKDISLVFKDKLKNINKNKKFGKNQNKLMTKI
jgi:hypothetical protein